MKDETHKNQPERDQMYGLKLLDQQLTNNFKHKSKNSASVLTTSLAFCNRQKENSKKARISTGNKDQSEV